MAFRQRQLAVVRQQRVDGPLADVKMRGSVFFSPCSLAMPSRPNNLILLFAADPHPVAMLRRRVEDSLRLRTLRLHTLVPELPEATSCTAVVREAKLRHAKASPQPVLRRG